MPHDEQLGRNDESLDMYRSIYEGTLELSSGREVEIYAAIDLAEALLRQSKYSEAKKFLIPRIREATRFCGPDATLTLELRYHYAAVLFFDENGTMADQRKAITTLRNICQIAEPRSRRAKPRISNASSDDLARLRLELFRGDLGFWEKAVAVGDGSPARTRTHARALRAPG